MRILIDIVHPAHVHFYRYMIQELESQGHETLVASRHKDVTIGLLDALQIPHIPVSRIGRATRRRQAVELLKRDWGLWKLARQFGPDLILTRNPSGVQVARLCGAIGVFDTDDGRAAGLLFHAAAPFAHVITTPSVIDGDFGEKHRTYPSYKAMAYLHPDRYQPDKGIRQRLGLGGDEPYSLIRLVSLEAVHDHGVTGLVGNLLQETVRRLNEYGRVFISSERALPPSLARYATKVAVLDWLHAMAFADFVVGDSASVTIEAALLGTPSLQVSSFAGRLESINELADRYGLVEAFLPLQDDRVLSAIDRILNRDEMEKQQYESRWRAMLGDKIDVTAWYLELIEELRMSKLA